MNNFNYALFEMLKYKIEFIEFLEYSLPNYKIKEKDVKNKYKSLKNSYNKGLYKDIVGTLFSNYSITTKSINKFFLYYNPKKILKMINQKKIKVLVSYNQRLIDCFENFNNIMSAIMIEKVVSEIVDEKISHLSQTTNDYFTTFLFFNVYHTYIDCILNKNSQIKFKERDLKNVVSIINYCNKENKYQDYINKLIENNEKKINNQTEQLLKLCINLENELNNELKNIINKLNNEIEKSKK